MQVLRAENVILIYRAAVSRTEHLLGATRHEGLWGEHACVMPLTCFPRTKHLNIVTYRKLVVLPGGVLPGCRGVAGVLPGCCAGVPGSGLKRGAAPWPQ